MKAATIKILRLDDEGSEHSETITVGDVSEHGRWTQTVKDITIGEDCLLDHDGTCKECVWDAVGKDEEKRDCIIVYVNELRAEVRSAEPSCCRVVKATIIRKLEELLGVEESG